MNSTCRVPPIVPTKNRVPAEHLRGVPCSKLYIFYLFIFSAYAPQSCPGCTDGPAVAIRVNASTLEGIATMRIQHFEAHRVHGATYYRHQTWQYTAFT